MPDEQYQCIECGAWLDGSAAHCENCRGELSGREVALGGPLKDGRDWDDLPQTERLTILSEDGFTRNRILQEAFAKALREYGEIHRAFRCRCSTIPMANYEVIEATEVDQAHRALIDETIMQITGVFHAPKEYWNESETN